LSLLDEIEKVILSAYLIIVQAEHNTANSQKTLNCGSYVHITREIKSILIECNRKGFNVLDTTNTIIYELLQRNYFMYSNHTMATYIGYTYLQNMAQVKNRFSTDGINNNSTLQDINMHTSTW
jgi:hypothetical protein